MKRISKEIRLRAHEQRKSSTPAEQIVWQALRNRNQGDYKFRRQHPIDPYIADFFMPKWGWSLKSMRRSSGSNCP